MVKEEVLRSNNFHATSPKDLFKSFKTNKNGLKKREAERRIKEHGLNQLPEKKKHTYIFAFFKQFRSIFIYILILAAGISYYIDHLVDFYVISGIIIINVSIGFMQEQKAERAINALKKLVVSYAKVFRDGELVSINSKEIAVGDIILLEEGDRIPADARLIKIKNFKTIEASLTGESLPVLKSLKNFPKNTIVADRKNMVFSGTFVATGNAQAIVVKIGASTEVGKIAQSITEIKRRETHFQNKVDKLALQMGTFAIIGAAITFLVGFFLRNFDFFEIFLFSIASLISGIPEGLPAVLSMVLAIGSLRMAKHNAIIRNLPSAETLGVVNTIITDKTGTLTQNVMTVTKAYTSNGDLFEITGNGWEPKGDFKQNGKTIIPLENKNLAKLLNIGAVATKARIIKEIDKDKKESYKCLGDPTEAAVVALAEKAGLRKEVLDNQIRKIDEMPFDQKLRYKASFCFLKKENKKELFVLGAPEQVLERCFLQNSEKANLIQVLNKMTSEALRVIAIACRDYNEKEISDRNVTKLKFLGFVGMIDPPREGVKESIEKAKDAGIRVIMATGDHRNTALAIGRKIGLANHNDIAFDQKELEKLSEKEFRKTIRKANIFARLTPNMKLKIAESLQKDGQIIAMTGDGVNDAPALKKADIGIAMGMSGTDVARESSEMILADDDFTTIINAVDEGRTVFRNTRRTSFFLITTNVSEHITIIASLFLGLPLPLLPTQILWLNLVTDTGAGIGLATEPGHTDTLNRKPINKNENIINKSIIPYLFIVFLTMVILTLIVFNYFLIESVDKARTGAFLVMAFTQLYNSFNMRSLKRSVFSIGITKNKTLILTTVLSIFAIMGILYIDFLSAIFNFARFSIFEVTALFVLSSIVLINGELYKFLFKKRLTNESKF